MSDKQQMDKDYLGKDEDPKNKMMYNKYDSGQDSPDKRRIYMRKKVCRFCADKTLKINYKHYDILRRFTTEGGKIIPRRMSGNCAKHQRLLATEIKRARFIALLPYVKS